MASQISEKDALHPVVQAVGPMDIGMARIRECEVLEGHMMLDMLISIPPKYDVAQMIGYIKGKNMVHVARDYLG